MKDRGLVRQGEEFRGELLLNWVLRPLKSSNGGGYNVCPSSHVGRIGRDRGKPYGKSGLSEMSFLGRISPQSNQETYI
jgi:hypothetical protein